MHSYCLHTTEGKDVHKSLMVISHFGIWECGILFQWDIWCNASDSSHYISSCGMGEKGKGGKEWLRDGKSYLVPSIHNFCDYDPPFSPKFTLKPKNCTQAKAESQHHHSHWTFNLDAETKTLRCQIFASWLKCPVAPQLLWRVLIPSQSPSDLPKGWERRKRYYLPVKAIVVIFTFTPCVQKDQRKAESCNEQWEKHAFPLERERKDKQSELCPAQSN